MSGRWRKWREKSGWTRHQCAGGQVRLGLCYVAGVRRAGTGGSEAKPGHQLTAGFQRNKEDEAPQDEDQTSKALG
jgi:hypothetical protein